jgi:hypothetical protein
MICSDASKSARTKLSHDSQLDLFHFLMIISQFTVQRCTVQRCAVSPSGRHIMLPAYEGTRQNLLSLQLIINGCSAGMCEQRIEPVVNAS